MAYVLITVFTFLLGIYFLYLCFEKNKSETFGAIGTILLLYGVFSIVPIFAHSNSCEDLKKYEKAKSELDVLQKSDGLPIHLVLEFKNDIDEMNDLIEKSEKWHNNLYLSPFYYEEIGKLDKLIPDTTKTKEVKIFY